MKLSRFSVKPAVSQYLAAFWGAALAAGFAAPAAVLADTPAAAHGAQAALPVTQAAPLTVQVMLSGAQVIPHETQAAPLTAQAMPHGTQAALHGTQAAPLTLQAMPLVAQAAPADSREAWQAVPIAAVPEVKAQGTWAGGRLHDVRYGEVLLGDRLLRLGKTSRLYFMPERLEKADAEKQAIGKLAFAEYEAQNISRLISVIPGRSQGTRIWQAYCAKIGGASNSGSAPTSGSARTPGSASTLGSAHPQKENFFKAGQEIVFIGRAPSGSELHFCCPGFFADEQAAEVAPGVYALRSRVPSVNLSALVMASLKGENWEYRGDFFYHLCGEPLEITQAGPIGNACADSLVFASFKGLPQAIDLEGSFLEIDGARVRSRCTAQVIMADTCTLAPGEHTAKAVIGDKAGNICEKSWNFTVR